MYRWPADVYYMKVHVYALVALGISTFLLGGYAYLKDHFHDPSPYHDRIGDLEEEVEREKFRLEISRLEHEEFRQSVATILPDALKDNKEMNYPKRLLASVTQRQEADYYRTLQANSLFVKAKALFRAKDYHASNPLFKKIIQDHSYSSHLAEAYFLLAEGHFQLSQYEQSVKVIKQMVQLYPETELTGFALLRLGKVYEFQDRPAEALQLYQTVLRSFPQRSVASQATQLIRSVNL